MTTMARQGSRIGPDGQTLLEVRGLSKEFGLGRGAFGTAAQGGVKAVNEVTFSIRRGETLGLVGESGCGKTTTGRCILQLERPTAGKIIYDGRDTCTLSPKELRRLRRRMQIIFQDPFGSLNPRMKVGKILQEPLLVHGAEPDRVKRRERVYQLLDICGLDSTFYDRFPHEMSGGQRQRVGIARALALNPEFIVCDEAVSALDVSIQAQIINLLEDLRSQLGLTYLFISHDLSVVRHLCDRVAVMYLGRIVEMAPTEELFSFPMHPYTRALIEAVPSPNPQLESSRPHNPLGGEVPSPANPPTGCVFHPRCPASVHACSVNIPELRELRPDHWVACIRAEELNRKICDHKVSAKLSLR